MLNVNLEPTNDDYRGKLPIIRERRSCRMKKRVKLFLALVVLAICFAEYRTSKPQIDRDLMQIKTIIDKGLTGND